MSGTQLQVKLTTTAIAWRDHIFAWQASGLSQTEYCSRHKVNINQFWNWKCKFNQAGITKKIRTKHPTTPFVPVTVTDTDAAVGQKEATSGDSGVSVALALCLLDEPGLDLERARLDTNGSESLDKQGAIAILAQIGG